MSDGLAAARLARTQAAVAVELETVSAADTSAPAAVPQDLKPTAAVDADLAGDVPPPVVVLNVSPSRIEDDDAYAVVASWDGAVHTAPPCFRPHVALGDLAQGTNVDLRHDPSEVLDAAYEWSTENKDISNWLRDRLEEHGELCVVVIDHTGYELPWELLTLFPRAYEGEDRYLGIAAPIARWQTVEDAVTAQSIPLEVKEELVAGGVVAFVDRTELAGQGSERATLDKLGARSQPALKQLVAELVNGCTGVGLIYVATHGHHGVSLRDVSIGSGNDRVKLAGLRRKKLIAFRTAGRVVFLNVCHAGRMLREHEYFFSERLRGFPEVFLGHGAKGVIAATGAVDDAYAAEIAEWALARLAAEPEVTAPELLREWRATMLRELPPDADERQLLRALTAFLYVYYGNPLARLRIDA